MTLYKSLNNFLSKCDEIEKNDHKKTQKVRLRSSFNGSLLLFTVIMTL